MQDNKYIDIKKTLSVIAIFLFFTLSWSQEYDMLIKGGHIIDPKNGIDEKMDIAIVKGKIAEIATSISEKKAQNIIDATDLYVTPGLIDLHVHVFYGTEPDSYLSNGYMAVQPDAFSFRNGVTTMVDAGGAGWRNFRIFKENVIDRSRTRILAFMNIVGAGMKDYAIEQNLADMDPKLAAITARRFKEDVVGFKLAHYDGFDWTPTERTVEAGRIADLPVMIDFGSSKPVLPIEELFMDKLRPGDIYTHCFGLYSVREPILTENWKLKDFIIPAQKRGLVFDVGHGGSSFSFQLAVPALQQGFKPNAISTDLHASSMMKGMKDMNNVMSKFLAMGMSVQEVIERSTWGPAQHIKRTELGHLSVGATADIAVLNIRQGDFGFVDADEVKLTGSEKFECELTIFGGEIVYDLNGISKALWKK